MALQAPRLDDRAFNDLIAEARAKIPLYCPEWTDHNLSDPGITILELFAWMSDIILYRLNRVPDKNFIRFMEVMGIRLEGAESARSPVTFWLSAPQLNTITIPTGTEVATVRTETEASIVFSVDRDADILVPVLAHVLTSSPAAEGRSFINHNVTNITNGQTPIAAFASTPPQTDDAFYIGFEQDLSNHILGLELEVERAEGAGIDPNNPPYVFEVLGREANQNWVQVEVDRDTTLGFNTNGVVRLFLPPMRRAPRNDINAFWLRVKIDLQKNPPPPNYGVSPTIKRLRVSSWGITADTTNITRIPNEVIGRSDGAPGQFFYLVHTPVATRSGNEYIMARLEDGREERWYEVTDFASSGPNDRHYTLDSQTGEIRFGPVLPQRDGTIRRYGAIPELSAGLIMTSYRYGGGIIGNVAASTLRVLKTSIPYIDRVMNRRPAAGGLNAEDLETCKHRVPAYLRSLGRAVTAADFEYLAREAAPGQIGRVHCLQPPLTARGEIKVLLIPSIPRLEGFIAPESLNLSEEVRQTIHSYLDERRLISTQLEVITPAYQWVETEVRIRASRHFEFEKVRRDVEMTLFQFLNPLSGGQDGTGWPFGRDLFVADVMSVLLKLNGVEFVRSVKLFPVSYDNGEYIRGAEVEEVPIVSHGVIVSYRHTVKPD